jgi:DNA helicase IV
MQIGTGTAKVEQIAAEQGVVDVMYARLDTESDRVRAARSRAESARVEGPGELFARDAELSRLADGIRQLQSAERSLCFGRIDGTENGEALHIGRIGLRTDAGDTLLIDWRSEAARPFYSATMAAPLGLHRRRHLRLEDREVVDVSDEILDGAAPSADDVVGDGPLVSALSGARTGRMRDAASTLQREQDEIVRSSYSGVVVVDGGPGTGKTIVALHRAAYVLYAFPSMAERGVLIYGPNRRFLRYISDVLPSLGENDVQLATLADVIGSEPTIAEPDAIARIKGQAEFAGGLARWVETRQPFGMPLRLHTAHGTVVLTADVVDTARRSAQQGGIGHNAARELFLEHIVDDLVNELEQQTAREASEFEAELKDVLGIDLERMFAGDHAPTGSLRTAAPDDLDIDWDHIRDDLLEDPGVDRIIERVWPRLRAEDAVRDLLADPASFIPGLREGSFDALAAFDRADATGWSSADLALLDEARALIDGPPRTVYGHIVIDEAQQLTEMQWRMLMRRCPQRSMTIVGDLAQAGPVTTVRRWDAALEPFVGERFAHHTLTVNYRTTAQILEATAPLLARIAPEQRLSRSLREGEPPTVVPVVDHALVTVLDGLIARTLHEHPTELIGVVASEERTAGLRERISETAATVIGAPDARGLEFDTVMIVDPVGIRSAGEAGLRDLYVAQTRATKRLLTLEVSEGSPRGTGPS